jgi:hypothetical protein
MTFLPGIITHLFTIPGQFRLLPPSVFKTMQMDPYSRLMQNPDLMKKIEYSSIVHRIGDIQAYYM